MSAILLGLLMWVGVLAIYGLLVLVDCHRKRRTIDTLDDLNAAEFIAELRTMPPTVALAHYTSQREPAALRALARQIAEEADRIEARHAYRGGAA